MSMGKRFYHFLVDDETSDEYDPNLPFGGIKKDTPEIFKKSYNEFLKEWKKTKSELISKGYSQEEAERELYREYNWLKVMITRTGFGLRSKYRKLIAEGMSKEDAKEECERMRKDYDEETQRLLHKYD